MQKRKRLFRWIKVILMAYGIIGIAIYYLQDYILFHPQALKKSEHYDFKEPHKDINIPFDEQSNLNIVEFTTGQAPKGVVLYYHGNRKNISWYARFAQDFTKNNYEVWMIDYPGYGKSTGPFSEQRLYEYSEQLYKLARSRFSKDSIIVYGKSMGTGLAAYVASKRDCKALILETPYYSMTSLARHYMPVYPVGRMIHYKIPTYQYLKEVIAPVTIFHGTADWVIPYGNAEKLQSSLKAGDQFITIEGGSHNDLDHFPLFRQKLDSLLK